VDALGAVFDRVVEERRTVVGTEPGAHDHLEREQRLAGAGTAGEAEEHGGVIGIADAAGENAIEAVDAGLQGCEGHRGNVPTKPEARHDGTRCPAATRCVGAS
jgi:hypothetical protein